ncbi:LCP family protein [Streptomyces hundungensis]|uniref:LCP family protein n=1 Tax=Streptomyces hundungensis TaxID=1077946 RepID=UPI0033D9477E
MAEQDTRTSRIRGAGKRRKQPSTRRRAVRIAAWSAAGVVLAGGAGLGYVYFQLNGNLKGVDINARLGTDRPQNVDNGSMDILVLGSDSRAGANKEYGADEGGARSDTAMVVHVYQGHKTAGVVSIPRDALITRPSCTTQDGSRTDPGAERQMFNTAYEVGGPACAVKTVEQMSGIRMDHYLEVDFTGFKKLIDELGGVPVTTNKPIKDTKSHLDLPAGRHTLDGEQALGLVRTRHGVVGDGSDLGRIQLQQAFIKALIGQVGSVGVLSNPTKLYGLANAATKAITTDTELNSVNSLIGFADGLKGLDAADVKMITLPVQYDKRDPNRVSPLPAQSRQVWDALSKDQPIPASATAGSAGDKGTAGGYVAGQ